MLILLVFLSFYNPQAGKIIRRKNSSFMGKNIKEGENNENVIEVDCDIAKARRASQVGYIISVPGDKEYWTYSIAANYICGSGDTYSYSPDIRYTQSVEVDGLGVFIVIIISLLITIVVCATWPVLSMISTDLHFVEKIVIEAIRGNKDEDESENGNNENNKRIKKNKMKDRLVVIWLLIAGVIMLFVSILVSQQLTSEMGWRNIYKKVVINKCFYIDRSSINDLGDVKRIKGDDVLGMGASSALMEYNKELDVATFSMECDKSIWDGGNGLSYEFKPPSNNNKNIGGDKCENIKVFVLKRVGIYETSTPNILRSCDENTIATPGINNKKCKGFRIWPFLSIIEGYFVSNLDYEVFATGNKENDKDFLDNSTKFLSVINNNKFNNIEKGWCTLNGCIVDRIYANIEEESSWSHCIRPEENMREGRAMRLNGNKYNNLSPDGFIVEGGPNYMTDEYYTDGTTMIEKNFKEYTGKIKYKIDGNDIEHKYDYIDGRIFVLPSSSGKNDVEIRKSVNKIFKNKALKSIKVTEKGLETTYTPPILKNGCNELGCTASIQPAGVSCKAIYKLYNASKYEEFRDPCDAVKVSNYNNKVYLSTEQSSSCNVVVRYNSGTIATTVIVSKEAPVDVTGAESWHCVTNEKDPSMGISCKGKNSAIYAFSVENKSISNIEASILNIPNSDLDQKEAAGDTSLDSNNLGHINNKNSTIRIVTIVGIVLAVIVVLAIILFIIFKFAIPRCSRKKNKKEEDSEIENTP